MPPAQLPPKKAVSKEHRRNVLVAISVSILKASMSSWGIKYVRKRSLRPSSNVLPNALAKLVLIPSLKLWRRTLRYIQNLLFPFIPDDGFLSVNILQLWSGGMQLCCRIRPTMTFLLGFHSSISKRMIRRLHCISSILFLSLLQWMRTKLA